VLVGGGEIIHTQDDLLASAYDMSPEEILAQRPSRWFIDGLGPELEKACPVLWHGVGIPFDPAREEGSRLRDALEWRPYVSVRDVKSLERLREAGVNGDTVLVPDSAFLVDRLYSSELLARRRAFHKLMGWVDVYKRQPPAGPWTCSMRSEPRRTPSPGFVPRLRTTSD